MQAVIYAFRSPGSGAVYIGKHQCCPDGWPRRGTGPLPDGYRGSGVAVANFHRRHGAAVQWRILATVAGGRDAVNAAERRAIRLARALFGRACVNRREGGDGFTSSDAAALNEEWRKNPRLVEKWKARLADWHSSPQFREVVATFHSDPEINGRRLAGLERWTASPEGQAHLRRTTEIFTSPEVRDKVDAWNASAAGKAHLKRMNTDPEIKAKSAAALPKAWAANRIYGGWRRLAAERPDLFDNNE